MFLKRIELFGFKSFADKTDIELSNGITALLGPNGCGKSNIADAIKWVFGEQSSKGLRADKMEDIIFAGTEGRKTLNVAEVALTFENDAQLPQLDISEFYVKRRIFRNGESEYFINNVQAKLKDVKKTLLDAGIGKSTYSMMEQGKIDQILSSKPEDRRYVFEEAANIARYRSTWQEASRKLQRTDENISQVNNILTEVKRTYATLEKQSEKTEQYHSLKGQLFEFERDICLLHLKGYQEQKSKKEESLENASTACEDIRKKIDGINEYLDANLDQVNALGQKVIDSEKQLHGLSIEKGGIATRNSGLSERIQEIEERIQQEKNSERGLKQRCDDLAEENAGMLEQITACAGRLQKTEEHVREFEERIKNARTRIVNNREKERAMDEENKALDTQLIDLQKQLQELTDNIVQELDEQLKRADLPAEKNTEEHLEEVLSRLGQLIRRYQQNLDDLSSPEEMGGTTFTLFNEALGGFESIHQEITSGLKEYKKTLPTFIETFLAPEGIITQKRHIDGRLLELRGTIDSNRQGMAVLRDEIKELDGKIEDYNATNQELLLNLERTKTEKKALEKENDTRRNHIAELKSQIQINRQKIAEDEGRLNGLRKRSAELGKEKEEIHQQEIHLQDELQKLGQEISKKHKILENKEKERGKHMEFLAKADDRHLNNQLSLTEVNTDIRNLRKQFQEQYSRDISEFEGMTVKGDLSSIRKQYRKAQERLRSLGSVNLMALEEFAEAKERYDFLNGQLQDLLKAKHDLKQVSIQVREEATEIFMKSYKQIGTNFSALFRKLFGGGRAELRLTDPENVLESGVEIYAQPPGKKLETLALFSGGERSLTAVALIFAAYMLKPAPFCFLDEIDAALDENNIGRFSSMLVEFARSSQFIIITHNKRTVASANTLLGVTMEEPGVSKTVAIRLAQEENLINA